MTTSVSLLPRGTQIVRFIRALGMARGSLIDAAEIARETWGAVAPPTRFLKAAAASGLTLPGGDWGSKLADFNAEAASFFALARERSIPGRMAGIRRIPLHTRLISQTGSASASWVKELEAKPVSAMTFTADTIPANKVASITVVSKELLEASSPAAESWLRDGLLDALTETLNVSFIDPGNAGVTDTEPASITNGAPSVAASGVWNDDLATLLGVFSGDLETSYFITSGVVAAGMAGLEHPNLTTRGGELSGVPSVVDKSVPTGIVVLADAAQIAFGKTRCALMSVRKGRSKCRRCQRVPRRFRCGSQTPSPFVSNKA